MSEWVGDVEPRLEPPTDVGSRGGAGADGHHLSAGDPDPDPDLDLARADAIAVTVGPGSQVLLVGSPLPSLGAALAARGCTITVLAAPGDAVAEPWASRVGAVDPRKPDPGSLRSFDAVVAPHLLDLAVDPGASLQRVAGALGPTGRIVLVAGPPGPAGALHGHDSAQVEMLCEQVGLVVDATTPVSPRRRVELVGGTTLALDGTDPVPYRPAGSTVVVAHRPAGVPPQPAGQEEVAIGPAMTVAVDRRIRLQQARIEALEEEIRALRATTDHPRRAAMALARALRARMRTLV